jgi:hypothetical protein
MQAYRSALGDDSTSVVLSPDSEFFRFFSNPGTELQSAGEQGGTTAPRERADQPLLDDGATAEVDGTERATAVE